MKTKLERLQAQLEAIEQKVEETFAKWLNSTDDATKSALDALKNECEQLEGQIAEEEAKAQRQEGSNKGAELEKKGGRKPGEQYSEETLEWLQKFRETTAAGGRFSGTLPTEVADYIFNKMATLGGIRQYVRTVKVSGDYAVLVDPDGVTISEVSSNYAETEKGFNALRLSAITFGGIAKLDRNMVADYAVDLVAYIGNMFAEAFLEEEENQVFNGAGVGDTRTHVRGITKNVATTTVTAASATAITWEEVKATLHKLTGKDRKNATIFVSQQAADAIFGFKDGNKYLFDQSKSLEKIIGVPVVVTDALGDLTANEYVMVAGNFNKYVLVERNGMELQTMDESYLKQGKVGIWASQRFDGDGDWRSFAALKMHAGA